MGNLNPRHVLLENGYVPIGKSWMADSMIPFRSIVRSQLECKYIQDVLPHQVSARVSGRYIDSKVLISKTL